MDGCSSLCDSPHRPLQRAAHIFMRSCISSSPTTVAYLYELHSIVLSRKSCSSFRMPAKKSTTLGTLAPSLCMFTTSSFPRTVDHRFVGYAILMNRFLRRFLFGTAGFSPTDPARKPLHLFPFRSNCVHVEGVISVAARVTSSSCRCVRAGVELADVWLTNRLGFIGLYPPSCRNERI